MKAPAALGLAVLVAGLAVATGAGAARTVSIYAPRGTGSDCTRVFPLRRTVATPRVLEGAIRALLAGPTRAERNRGFGGWFSAKTSGHVRTVRIVHGVAYIDFRSFARAIPNASTSCGSALLLAQLDRTARQFRGVRAAIYSFDGSQTAFYAWLQRDVPRVSR